MYLKRIVSAGIACVFLGLAATNAAQSAVQFFTCVGGASGMTLQLNPYATGGVQRGCAPKMMTISLRQKNTPPNTGVVKYAYTKVRIKANDPAWSEPDNTAWPSGQKIKFTGDQADAEIAYLKLSNNDII